MPIDLIYGAYPNAENIEFIVPTAPGGPTDSITRIIVDKLQEKSNLKFNVFYKPGAAQTIAFQYINQSKKPSLIVATNTIKDDELYKTSTQIYRLGLHSNVVMVKSNSNLKSIDDLIELSKNRQINFGHGGVGTSSYHAMLKFCEKLNCLPVPYKGTSQGMLDILNGSIDAYAPVSFGLDSILQNPNYKPIGKIYISDNWVILFGKNLSSKDSEIIKRVLSDVDKDFYTNMGLE
jgi:tripartite-type tricarboxylate transporter receptor subunit TctC